MNLEKIKKIEKNLDSIYKRIDDICFLNSLKVINAFWKHGLSESHFNGTTGYGYGDAGRDTLEKIYSTIFKTEDALVRGQFISGTHALSTCLFGLLRPGDILLSITGKPYDTLESVIGIKENSSSLKAFNVKYKQVDLINDEFDFEKIKRVILKEKVKVVEIQRSVGYSNRKAISIKALEEVIKFIKILDKDIIVMVDNCYCEFVSSREPTEVGADICVGSLIKNLGGGVATHGAYIVGRKDLVHLASERLNMAGEGKEVGPSLGVNKSFYQGLYMAPSVVASSLKTAVFASYLLEKKGTVVSPRWNDERSDIVQKIIFNDENLLIKFVQGIQMGSAVDANVLAIASDMPGYDEKIIMASGSFTQGSSIEISCDGPIRPPYIAYLQGGLTYDYGKIAILKAIKNTFEN